MHVCVCFCICVFLCLCFHVFVLVFEKEVDSFFFFFNLAEGVFSYKTPGWEGIKFCAVVGKMDTYKVIILLHL